MSVDPFAAIPDADPSAVEVRRRAFQRPEQTCDLVGKPKRKRTDLNPQQRRWFEREGYTFARVEAQNAWGGMTADLWGVFDYIATRADQPGILFVQVTDKTHVSQRRRKIQAAEVTPVLLASGNRIQIHAWSQRGGPGSRWEVQIEEITPETTPKTSSRRKADITEPALALVP